MEVEQPTSGGRWPYRWACGALVVLAVVPLVPAIMTAAVMVLFDDNGDPTLNRQLDRIAIGLVALAVAAFLSLISMLNTRLWLGLLGAVLLALGYACLWSYRDMIALILLGK
jgi:hypothetical protein